MKKINSNWSCTRRTFPNHTNHTNHSKAEMRTENIVAGISGNLPEMPATSKCVGCKCVGISDTFWHLQSDLTTKNFRNSAPVPGQWRLQNLHFSETLADVVNEESNATNDGVERRRREAGPGPLFGLRRRRREEKEITLRGQWLPKMCQTLDRTRVITYCICTRIMVYNGHLITATLGSLDFFEIF